MVGNEFLDQKLVLKSGLNQIGCDLYDVPFSSGKFIINIILIFTFFILQYDFGHRKMRMLLLQ